MSRCITTVRAARLCMVLQADTKASSLHHTVLRATSRRKSIKPSHGPTSQSQSNQPLKRSYKHFKSSKPLKHSYEPFKSSTSLQHGPTHRLKSTKPPTRPYESSQESKRRDPPKGHQQQHQTSLHSLIFVPSLSRNTNKMSTSTELSTCTLKQDPLTPIEGKPTPDAVHKLCHELYSYQYQEPHNQPGRGLTWPSRDAHARC
jgi:hypothetical protein